LVYLNQYRRNANITGEKVDQDRVVLTMSPGDHSCRVENAAAI
jgi:Mce-associated membrane protein